MKLDNEFFEIGKVIIEPSNCFVGNEKVNTNIISIISKDNNIALTIYTFVPYDCFNALEMNIKTDITDKIDDYDICLYIKDDFYINSVENTEVYFTKLEKNKFKLNVIINDLRNNIVSNLEEDDIKITKVEVESIVDFNGVKKV